MNNKVDIDFVGMREKYPHNFTASFFSTKKDTSTGQNLVPADTDNGLVAYMEALADATTTPQVRELVPFTNMQSLEYKNCLFIHSITLFAYDPTRDGLSDTADAIIATQLLGSGVTRSYPQSNYLRGAMPVTFQPNFCRPAILVNGQLINQGFIDGPKGSENNKGFKSLGLPLNTCIIVGEEIQQFDRISINTAMAQYISGEATYQNYPVQAIVEFWV
jgi:hypothetical protein